MGDNCGDFSFGGRAWRRVGNEFRSVFVRDSFCFVCGFGGGFFVAGGEGLVAGEIGERKRAVLREMFRSSTIKP
jgi:hypothetical protein